MSTITRCLAATRRTTYLAASLALVGFFGACSEVPTSSSSDASGPILAKKGGGGKPPQCDAFPALTITLRSLLNPLDALRDDGKGSYKQGEGNGSLGAHLSGNGNLMFWPSQNGVPDREVEVTTTAFSDPTTDRIFTNSHVNPSGDNACGLAGMVDGSGSAVLEVELDSDGIVRYGKLCNGDPDDGNRVTTFRSGNTWTISGSSGRHCQNLSKRKGKPSLSQVGTAGEFSMTLVAS